MFANRKTDLQQTLADFIKHNCVSEEEEIKDNLSSLESIGCQVVTLDENPV